MAATAVADALRPAHAQAYPLLEHSHFGITVIS